jgi:hypothetical protein
MTVINGTNSLFMVRKDQKDAIDMVSPVGKCLYSWIINDRGSLYSEKKQKKKKDNFPANNEAI